MVRFMRSDQLKLRMKFHLCLKVTSFMFCLFEQASDISSAMCVVFFSEPLFRFHPAVAAHLQLPEH